LDLELDDVDAEYSLGWSNEGKQSGNSWYSPPALGDAEDGEFEWPFSLATAR
jgi:hypothetical protein